MVILRYSRAIAFLLLTLSPGSGHFAWAAGEKVGEVVRAAPKVEGSSGNTSPRLMTPGAGVEKGMKVKTSRKARAEIAINIDLRKKGTVRLGPDTDVVFTEYVVDRARGIPTKLSWLLQLGQFRVALLPGGTEPGEGEYWIETPTAKKIRMAGTDVYVSVPHPWITYVYVLEGEVTVEARNGHTVSVAAGQWTQILRGESPTDPTNVPLPDGWLPREPPNPVDPLIDPPNIDVRRFELDLPKSIPP